MANNQGMLLIDQAKKLTEVNKTVPIWEDSTPKWLLKILDVTEIENTTFRINKVHSITKISHQMNDDEYGIILHDNVGIQDKPQQIELVTIESMIRIPSKIYDVMNYPHNQTNVQLKHTIDNIMEQQENYFINGKNGFVKYCTDNNRLLEYESTINPNILDDLLGLVYNKPTFYLMHPKTLVEFCKSCNSMGLNTGNMELFGYQFITWRGLPIITCNKIPYTSDNGSYKGSYVFLLRTGFDDDGVVQLRNANKNKYGYPGIFIEKSKTDNCGTVSTRISLYTNVAVLSNEAIACAKIL